MPDVRRPDNKMDEKQQKLKDQIQKDIAVKAKPKCNICGKFLYEPPKCPGHGGGSGGGGASEEKSGSSDEKTSGKIQASSSSTVSQSAESTLNDVMTDPSLQLRLDERTFNPEIISELLSKKMLVIDNDIELGILTIKLQCNPKDLSELQRKELNKFVDTILKELDKFKEENGISAKCKTAHYDKQGNIISLRISLPTPALYNAFIQRLANKNLLSVQNIEQRKNEKVVYPEGRNHFNLTPLSIKPTPENKKSIEEENQKTGEKKSSVRPKSPLDGLKPKGFE